MEFILIPVPFISQIAILVIQSAKSMHFILMPVTIVHASILVVKLTLPMSHIMEFVSFIPTALLKSLDNILQVIIPIVRLWMILVTN